MTTLPLAVRPDQREVDLVEAGEVDWSRPFWNMSVEGLRENTSIEPTTIDFDELRAMVGEERPAPAGMIFHIGRCGSTLVSRMLGHDPGLHVLREASTIGSLHRGSGGGWRVPTFTIEQAFQDVLVLHEWYAASRGQRLLVKHSSWESFAMARLAELLPTTPFVFCYRDPIAVVESSLDGHPGWAGRIHAPRNELQRWVPWLDRIETPFNAAAIYASVWAAGANAALSMPPDRVLLVEYERLVSEPDVVLGELAMHLRVTETLDVRGALGQLDTYSKARVSDVRFQADVTDAHPKLTRRTAHQVREIVGDLPDRLAARSRPS